MRFMGALLLVVKFGSRSSWTSELASLVDSCCCSAGSVPWTQCAGGRAWCVASGRHDAFSLRRPGSRRCESLRRHRDNV